MRGVGEDLGDRPIFDDSPRVHHGDSVAHVRDDAEVVGDEQDRQVELFLEVLQEVQILRLGSWGRGPTSAHRR